MSTCKILRMISIERSPVLDVVHDLPLSLTNLAYDVVESDAVQNRADGEVDVRPDRLELAGALSDTVVIEVTRFETRKLDERPAHASEDISDGDFGRRPRQRISTIRSAFAPHDLDPLENLHDLEEKLDRNALPVRDVLNADGSVRIVFEREFENG